MIVYGIPNCNTVKKALTWLKEKGFNPEFHDFKKSGTSVEKLRLWCDVFGWERVLNKKGTTWRKLAVEEQALVKDRESAIAMLMKNASAIKRPVVEVNDVPVLIGFEEAQYTAVLS